MKTTETSAESTTSPAESTTSPASPPAPNVWPTLKCHDALGLIDFLVTTFGFERTAVYADGPTVHHAQLTWPEGGGVMLGSVIAGTPWQREPGTAGIYLVTDRVGEIHQRCQEAGASIIEPLTDTDYGSHTFAVADPEGNYWSIGTYAGEPRST